MPQIIVREKDNTRVGVGLYTNFSVLIPGLVSEDADGLGFDENGVCECSSKDDFKKHIGYVRAQDLTIIPASGETEAVMAKHYGNQIAYELIELGYTVLYKKVTETTASDLKEDTFWAALKDKSIYDFRYVLSGFIGQPEVDAAIARLAHSTYNSEENEDNGRGDCVALIDIPDIYYTADNKTQAEAVTAIKGYVNTLSGENVSPYVAYFAPYVDYIFDKKVLNIYGEDNGSSLRFPASFHYLACAAKAAENYNEWYAIAGYNLGISNLAIKGVGCRFGDQAVRALQPRYKKLSGGIQCAVNLIETIRGSYYLWGNRTAKALGDENGDEADLKASHFLNIRQLCSSIKKQIYITCRRHTFNPNSDLLWGDFCADIRPLLEKMKGDQGVRDYRFIKVKVNQKALLKAIIRIVPIEAVEDFDVTLTLEDSLSGILIDDEDVAA